MIAALVGLALIAGMAFGFSIGRWSNSRETEAMLDRRLGEFRVQEHARLLEQSREAHYHGEVGMADLLAQAAERVLHPDRPKP
jgi:hypothetical protein